MQEMNPIKESRPLNCLQRIMMWWSGALLPGRQHQGGYREPDVNSKKRGWRIINFNTKPWKRKCMNSPIPGSLCGPGQPWSNPGPTRMKPKDRQFFDWVKWNGMNRTITYISGIYMSWETEGGLFLKENLPWRQTIHIPTTNSQGKQLHSSPKRIVDVVENNGAKTSFDRRITVRSYIPDWFVGFCIAEVDCGASNRLSVSSSDLITIGLIFGSKVYLSTLRADSRSGFVTRVDMDVISFFRK